MLAFNEIEVTFAHQTFAWTSEATGTAQVHVVIVGIAPRIRARKSRALYEYPDTQGEPQKRIVRHINWYLTDGPSVYPAKHKAPLVKSVPPPPLQGSKPVDDGGLLVTPDQYEEVASDPDAARYLRPFKQSKGLLRGIDRWCFWLEDANPAHIMSSAVLKPRITRRAGLSSAFRHQRVPRSSSNSFAVCSAPSTQVEILGDPRGLKRESCLHPRRLPRRRRRCWQQAAHLA